MRNFRIPLNERATEYFGIALGIPCFQLIFYPFLVGSVWIKEDLLEVGKMHVMTQLVFQSLMYGISTFRSGTDHQTELRQAQILTVLPTFMVYLYCYAEIRVFPRFLLSKIILSDALNGWIMPVIAEKTLHRKPFPLFSVGMRGPSAWPNYPRLLPNWMQEVEGISMVVSMTILILVSVLNAILFLISVVRESWLINS
jgi:hypothetical protein